MAFGSPSAAIHGAGPTHIVAMLVGVLLASGWAGCGGGSDSSTTATTVPAGDIAVIDQAPDGTITKEDFDRSLTQTAARQGIKEVPSRGDPQYNLLADAAVSDLILSRWVLGEAEERGIEVSDREIDDELQNVMKQQFGSQKAFDQFLKQSGLTLDEARERVKLQLISQEIQTDVLGGANGSEQQQVADQFKTQFTDKWRARTVCAEEYLTDRCSNAPEPTESSSTTTTPGDEPP